MCDVVSFYEEKLVPIMKKVSCVIEETPQMQDILNGTVSLERFQFQIKQNYQKTICITNGRICIII